jgi:pimeloyl-ACP methyl ester carboxylesterase
MRPETIRLGGNRQSVIYRGGDGPPLVWLHSLYGVEADAPVIDRLSERYAVVAPLAPGFADLDELERLRDIHDLALHYDDLLEALQLEHVVAAGHSFGAMIAAELAAHVPNRVSRLVLLSPLGLWHDDYPVADLFGVPPADVPGLLYADPARAPGSGPQPDVESVIALARGMTTVARFLWPIPDRGLARRLYRVRAPTLVVHGAEDRFVPAAYADDFVALLPNASREIIPAAGHMLTVEALDQTLAVVDRFLSGAWNSPAAAGVAPHAQGAPPVEVIAASPRRGHGSVPQ